MSTLELTKSEILKLATIIQQWDDAFVDITQAVVGGTPDEVRILIDEHSLGKMSRTICLALKYKALSCKAIIQLCKIFERVASGFDVEIKNGWLDDARAIIERLKIRLALELYDPKRKKSSFRRQAVQTCLQKASAPQAQG